MELKDSRINPLGLPYNGSSKLYNLLCLCPNHVLFDNGGFVIEDDLTLTVIAEEKLIVDFKKNKLDSECIKYHRDHYSN